MVLLLNLELLFTLQLDELQLQRDVNANVMIFTTVAEHEPQRRQS